MGKTYHGMTALISKGTELIHREFRYSSLFIETTNGLNHFRQGHIDDKSKKCMKYVQDLRIVADDNGTWLFE